MKAAHYRPVDDPAPLEVPSPSALAPDVIMMPPRTDAAEPAPLDPFNEEGAFDPSLLDEPSDPDVVSPGVPGLDPGPANDPVPSPPTPDVPDPMPPQPLPPDTLPDPVTDPQDPLPLRDPTVEPLSDPTIEPMRFGVDEDGETVVKPLSARERQAMTGAHTDD
ncbi:hypothetical protein [Methylobrevis albus]|uniref:Uncharacterized protein n=1 Tax=Methylobrevis albus TaxID=2793297 RepID=A0A931I266_9HYPH|nr:hypothetical protein [Methylobrevis albus]MBH0237523.1 hypothetical protein [Methylobrevis albus]